MKTKRLLQSIGILCLAWLMPPTADAQSHSAMPPGMTHEEHMTQMKKDADLKSHGAMAMGFDQDATTHHFHLTATGGAIEVSANNAGDQLSVGQIRNHLKEIAGAFGRGDFAKPLMTHDETPPGVSTMQALKTQIAYKFEETPQGGMVRITTKNSLAQNAVHDFLQYQIWEHKTGDPLSVRK